jgi:hypothetical protein
MNYFHEQHYDGAIYSNVYVNGSDSVPTTTNELKSKTMLNNSVKQYTNSVIENANKLSHRSFVPKRELFSNNSPEKSHNHGTDNMLNNISMGSIAPITNENKNDSIHLRKPSKDMNDSIELNIVNSSNDSSLFNILNKQNTLQDSRSSLSLYFNYKFLDLNGDLLDANTFDYRPIKNLLFTENKEEMEKYEHSSIYEESDMKFLESEDEKKKRSENFFGPQRSKYLNPNLLGSVTKVSLKDRNFKPY